MTKIAPGTNLSERPINGKYGWGPATGSAANPDGSYGYGYTYNVKRWA